MLNKEVTIVIPSYKSRSLLINHLNNFSQKYRVIVIENSGDQILKKIIKKKFKNNKILLRKNIGFGRAVNLGARYVKTNYFFVINPDTKIYKNTIKNLIIAAKKLKFFGGLCPEHLKNKRKNFKRNLLETKKLYGGAMFFETKNFKKIKGFDENIFLYYEENDFFHKCIKLNLKMYIIKNCFHFHAIKQSSSAIMENENEKYYSYLLSGWHGQWSKFYYFKKHKNYISSFFICFPSLLKNLIQLIINIFFNQKKAKFYYFKIEGLVASMLGFKSYKRSIYD